MDPAVAFTVLSVLGAVLFAAGGYFLRHGRNVPSEPSASSAEEVRRARETAAAAETEAQRVALELRREREASAVAQREAQAAAEALHREREASAAARREAQAAAEALHREREASAAAKREAPSVTGALRQARQVAAPGRVAESKELHEATRAAQAARAAVADAEARARAFEVRSSETEQRARAAEKEAAKHAARVQELDKMLAKLRGQLDDAQAQRTVVRPPGGLQSAGVQPTLGPARDEVEAQKRSVEEERDTLQRRCTELDHERKRFRELAEELRSRTQRMEEEQTSMSKERDIARRAAEDTAHDLVVHQTQIKAERARSEELAVELSALREVSREAATLRKQHDELVEEHRRLSARQFAEAPKTNVEPAEDPSGDVMNVLVDRVVSLERVRSVAITDALGFAVVGRGEHVDALAAFGAFIVDVGARAEGLLPVESAAEVTVRDRNGVVLTARALPGPSELALVTLGVGDESSAPDVDKIISETPRVAN